MEDTLQCSRAFGDRSASPRSSLVRDPQCWFIQLGNACRAQLGFRMATEAESSESASFIRVVIIRYKMRASYTVASRTRTHLYIYTCSLTPAPMSQTPTALPVPRPPHGLQVQQGCPQAPVYEPCEQAPSCHLQGTHGAVGRACWWGGVGWGGMREKLSATQGFLGVEPSSLPWWV